MAKSTETVRKYHFRCDACGYETEDEYMAHQTISSQAFCSMEELWDADHYKHRDTELSFCEACGPELWSALLREIHRIRTE